MHGENCRVEPREHSQYIWTPTFPTDRPPRLHRYRGFLCPSHILFLFLFSLHVPFELSFSLQHPMSESVANTASNEMKSQPEKGPIVRDAPVGDGEGEINASGHKQELQRNFSLLSICAIAITTGNSWIAQGGSVTTAIYNGGPCGIIYEL
jgi:hypothetical protein